MQTLDLTKISMAEISNYIGLIGVIMVLTTYFLLQIGKLSVKNLSYSAANFVGSIFILFSLYYHWNFASVVIEFAWLLISAIGLYKYIKNHLKTSS